MSLPRRAVCARIYVCFLHTLATLCPRVSLIALALICGITADNAAAADAGAAQSLAQKSGCFKCHGVDKKKDGPALRDAAAKYKGNSDAQQKLVYHVTSGEKVKFDDGHEEEHKKVKTSNLNEVKNLVDWILSLEGGTKY